jgi:hypothetical protein
MGNLIATCVSVVVPLITKSVWMPYIYHPNRWGGIPWVEPNWLLMGIITFVLNAMMLSVIGTISGMMSTKGECDRYDVYLSVRRSVWMIMGYVIGNIMLFIVPYIKAPILPFFMWMPYAGWIVHGMLVGVVILLFGAMGNAILRKEVCVKPGV